MWSSLTNPSKTAIIRQPTVQEPRRTRIHPAEKDFHRDRKCTSLKFIIFTGYIIENINKRPNHFVWKP